MIIHMINQDILYVKDHLDNSPLELLIINIDPYYKIMVFSERTFIYWPKWTPRKGLVSICLGRATVKVDGQ